MTVKLLLLKSGEEIIADVKEMVISVGDETEQDPMKKVVGYYLTNPCCVKINGSNISSNDCDVSGKVGFEVSIHPWIPLSSDKEIPIPSDWLVTMVNPTLKLEQMYVDEVLNYGKTDKDIVPSEQSDIDNED